MESPPSAAGLYPDLLGDDWRRLETAVRNAHLEQGAVRREAQGTLRVTHGRHPVVRAALWLLRMPPPADQAAAQVVVTRIPGGECWTRTVGGRQLITRQFARPGGVLGETMGGLELRFQIAAENGVLLFRQTRAFVRLGTVCLPLPRWLGPHAVAREEAAGCSHRTRVVVEVSGPLVGPILRYAGEMEWSPG